MFCLLSKKDDTWNYYYFLECYFVYGKFIYLFIYSGCLYEKSMARYRCLIT